MSIDTIRRICGRRQCLWAAARELTGRRTAAASEPEWLGWDAWVSLERDT